MPIENVLEKRHIDAGLSLDEIRDDAVALRKDGKFIGMFRQSVSPMELVAAADLAIELCPIGLGALHDVQAQCSSCHWSKEGKCDFPYGLGTL